MVLFRKYVLVFIVLTLFVISGCRSSIPRYHISQDIDFSFYKRVAVMPFDNLTNEKYASEIVRQVVMSELLASGLVDVVLHGDVKSIINELEIKAVSSLTADQIKVFGKSLNVEAIILGSVEEYGEVKMGSVSAPRVTISLMMADASSGSIIWSITRTKGGANFWARHFGASHKTISETVLMLVREAIQTLAVY
jgi:TolB-like protein